MLLCVRTYSFNWVQGVCTHLSPLNHSVVELWGLQESAPLVLMSFCFSELPAGWEKIEDPVYGVYYVE